MQTTFADCNCDTCTWFKGEDCLADPGGTVDCQEHTGACCDKATGNCTIEPESNCQGAQQQWAKDTPCSGVDCTRDEK